MELLRKWDCNVPTLRFKSFDQKWEYSTIGKCSISLEYGMNAAAVKFDGKHKYIRITDIDEETSDFIPNPLSSPDGVLEQKYLVKENDILFARTGASVGKSYLYNHNDGELYFAGFLIRARIKPEYNGAFIYYQTKSKKYDRWVKLTSMRSGQPGINSQEYSSYPIAIACKVEQDKIADFFQLLDYRIAVQNKIISKYQTLIKGLCDMIFRHNKSVSLSDLVKCKTSALQENMVSTCPRGEYRVLGASGAIAAIDTYQFEESGILVLKDGSKAGKIQFAEGKYSVIGTSVVLIPNEACDAKYIYFAMSSIDFEKYKVGSGIPHIYFKDYSNERIYYPEKSLRKRITEALDAYDIKVRIEKEMLSALQKQKAFLIKSMFI